jgi:hypothetical protein
VLPVACFPRLLDPRPLTFHPLCSKLIDVSQANYTEAGSKMASEYPRLFNERFPAVKSQSSRPSSADANQEEDEATWLGNIIGNAADAEGRWERVEPIESGALTIQFGEALGPDRRQVR